MTVEPAVVLYVPEEQKVHVVAEVALTVSLYDPAEHRIQSDETRDPLPVLYLPIRQDVHGDIVPEPMEYEPVGHRLQTVLLRPIEYVPGEQERQAEDLTEPISVL